MKLLLLAQKYPPIVGGGETHLQNLAEGLVARGHQVSVLTSRPDSALDVMPYRQAGVRVDYLEGLSEACRLGATKELLPPLFHYLTSERWDVVHVFNHVPAMLLSWLRPAVQATLCASLFETHVPGVRVFDLYRDYELERALQRSLVDGLHPDLLIAGSEAYRRWALQAGFPASRIEVVPFATEVQRFASAAGERVRRRRELELGDEFVFLVPARLVPRKRVEDALDALALVRRQIPAARLLLMHPQGTSDSAYVASLRQRLHELQLAPSVRLVENASWQAMPALYAASDAVILPSSHEGFGIALIEGMAARRPVITTDVEGHDEVIAHGETGYLYPAGDTKALAARMVEVATAPQADLLDRAERAVRANFEVEVMVKRHEALYARSLRHA